MTKYFPPTGEKVFQSLLMSQNDNFKESFEPFYFVITGASFLTTKSNFRVRAMK